MDADAVLTRGASIPLRAPSSVLHAPAFMVTLIGVDCATDPARVGLARGTYSAGAAAVTEVRMGTAAAPPADVVAGWAVQADGPVLLALDAPLGWPAPLGDTLMAHRAGAPVAAEAHALFRRATDLEVKTRLGKQPLDVGADRIARTAHAALRLLVDLRRRLGVEIPLVWEPTVIGIGAVEVYPAATLRAYGIDAKGYKAPDGVAARERVIGALGDVIDLPDTSLLREGADALDAAICVLAAADVMRGTARGPADRSLAEREGWIWVRDRVG